MKKRLKGYLRFLEGIEYSNLTEKEKSVIKTDLLTQIGFFQHERLIHLIVTVTFAILTVIAILGTMAWPGISMLLLTGLFLALLIPYIGHYYFLENGVQKLYEYYDKLTGISNNAIHHCD